VALGSRSGQETDSWLTACDLAHQRQQPDQGDRFASREVVGPGPLSFQGQANPLGQVTHPDRVQEDSLRPIDGDLPPFPNGMQQAVDEETVAAGPIGVEEA
jgi:hypothetical protein